MKCNYVKGSNFPVQSSCLLRVLFFFCFISSAAVAQTIGGNAAYNFLKLPSSPMLTAMGSVNTSYQTNEVSLAANNPALLSSETNSQINASFNAFLGGINAYSLTGSHHSNKFNTTFGGHIYFVDYGSLPLADASGNRMGEFRPVDFVVQVSAARKYLERWTYGGTVKFINSSYGQYRSNALAIDFGVLYIDSSNKFSLSFLAKNMGIQVKTYAGEKEDLPFDLQVGITKRLEKAPFGFSLTAHHLHKFNISYNDNDFNSDNGFTPPSGFDKVLNHFVIATHVYIGQHLEATIGYNHLRRQELSIQDVGNGLTGFSTGLRIRFSKLQILYARSAYQKGISYNQLGITAHLNKLTGLGK